MRAVFTALERPCIVLKTAMIGANLAGGKVCGHRVFESANLDMRKPYGNKTTILLEDQVKFKEPMGMFDSWFKEVQALSNIGYEEVNAMELSTATR
ncbi:hypothetical protein D918_02635 [Trichuris suis]|nr:hypothetical protein D918_02635 [Trichuris suis]